MAFSDKERAKAPALAAELNAKDLTSAIADGLKYLSRRGKRIIMKFITLLATAEWR